MNNYENPINLISKLYPIIEFDNGIKNKRPNKEKYFYTNKIPIEIPKNELYIDPIPKNKDENDFIFNEESNESTLINNNEESNESIEETVVSENKEEKTQDEIILPKTDGIIIEKIAKIDSEKLDLKLLLAMKRGDEEAESILDKSKYTIEKILEIEKKLIEKNEQNQKILNEKYMELLKNYNDSEHLKKRNMINQQERDQFAQKFNEMEGKQKIFINNEKKIIEESTNRFKQNQHLKNKLLLLKKK
jgi:hypothetical protein